MLKGYMRCLGVVRVEGLCLGVVRVEGLYDFA